jgi:ABC-type branched-subunit amino acid transport system substrate-binding protein
MTSDPRPLRLMLAAALLVVALTAACTEQPPLRIGVITDCAGPWRALEDVGLSGAALPLIERGAQLRGRRASDGIGTAEVAGRRVELVRGCTESLEMSTLTGELRRLVEREHVDVIVAGTIGPDEVVVREVARRYPHVLFVPVVRGPREVTLHRPAPNLYRFAADHGQGVAGLAHHAYHALGWRRVAIVAPGWDGGWGGRDAFTAEFCALGGRVISHVVPVFDGYKFDPRGRDVARVPRDVDGVAVLGASSFFSPNAFIARLARRVGDPERHIVLGPDTVNEPETLKANAGALDGVVAGSYLDPVRRREYLRAFSRAFPGVKDSVADAWAVRGFRDGVEVVLRGIERSGGDARRLPAALAQLRTELLGGPVQLDGARQAVVTSRLVRIGRAGTLTNVRSIPDVDQSLGGLLDPSASPSDRPTACRRGKAPPPWAR